MSTPNKPEASKTTSSTPSKPPVSSQETSAPATAPVKPSAKAPEVVETALPYLSRRVWPD